MRRRTQRESPAQRLILLHNGNYGPRKGNEKTASKALQMPVLSTDVDPLERPTQLADLKAARRELADNLLAAARGELPIEYPETAGELAAAFRRRYDDRRATQGAYALDLADWFVWLARAGIGPQRDRRDRLGGRCQTTAVKLRQQARGVHVGLSDIRLARR